MVFQFPCSLACVVVPAAKSKFSNSSGRDGPNWTITRLLYNHVRPLKYAHLHGSSSSSIVHSMNSSCLSFHIYINEIDSIFKRKHFTLSGWENHIRAGATFSTLRFPLITFLPVNQNMHGKIFAKAGESREMTVKDTWLIKKKGSLFVTSNTQTNKIIHFWGKFYENLACTFKLYTLFMTIIHATSHCCAGSINWNQIIILQQIWQPI